MKKEELNIEVYNKLIKSSELLLKKEYDRSVSIGDAFVWLNEIASSEDLNQVSDIYIYEEGFGNLNEKLKNTLFHAITSVISFEYSNINISYLENLILSDESKKNDVALDYLLKIGAYHAKFKDKILVFIDQNINVFSKNKLNIVGFYLATIYQKETTVVELFKAVADLNKRKYPSEENKTPSEESPIMDTSHANSKTWWKFW